MSGKIRNFWNLFKSLSSATFKEFVKNDPIRMSGATAFFTMFALPPILIILVQLLGLIFNPEKIRDQLYAGLADVIGAEAVHEIVETLTSFRDLAQNRLLTVLGFIFLFFVATTLFKVIKNSMNELWKIRITRKKSLWLELRPRLRSVLVIFLAGILFVLGVFIEAVQAFLGSYIQELSPEIFYYLNSFIRHVFSVFIVTLWFAILFRYLPDGRPAWRVALTGGAVTGVLFTLGKALLQWLLTYSNLNTLYGASASLVLLLLFVFYSSLILYFGATFTNIWADKAGTPIHPLPYAKHYKVTVVEEGV